MSKQYGFKLTFFKAAVQTHAIPNISSTIMCLAVIAYQQLDDWPLIIVANRDEFHARPTLAAQPWPESPTVLAGKDLQAGGSWLGVTQSGRVALLTNYREPTVTHRTQTSRGQLVADFLTQSSPPEHYLTQLSQEANMFSGFNLVVGDTSGLFYASNRFINPHYQAKPIEPGVWGLSNALFNTPWPKVLCTQGLVAAYLMQCQTLNVVPTTQQLAHIMRDTTPVPDAQLPQTGLPLERERQLATPFIVGEHYGTRCTSVIMQHRDGSIRFEEQSYLPCQTQPSATVSWQVDQPLSGKGWVRLKVN